MQQGNIVRTIPQQGMRSPQIIKQPMVQTIPAQGQRIVNQVCFDILYLAILYLAFNIHNMYTNYLSFIDPILLSILNP